MKAITLLSGGMDSLVSTSIAKQHGHKIILAITFDYGQRAAKREIAAAGKLCKLWNIPHKIIKLPWLGEITNTALVNRSKRIPLLRHSCESRNPVNAGDPCFRRDDTFGDLTARAVWVPNRNGLFINIAAGFAESLGAELIITGFNKEEAVTFPDNSKKFVSAINRSLKHSTAPLCPPLLRRRAGKRGERGDFKHPRVISYTQNMTKADMAAYAVRNELPLKYCWPCYEGGKRICRKCESCVRYINGLGTAYANKIY